MRKTLSLVLAAAMALSLAACGGKDTPAANNTGDASSVSGGASISDGSGGASEAEGDKSEAPDQSELDVSEPEQPSTPAVPAEMTYTFDAATGTLTCSGGGEIQNNEWYEVVKNAIFETDQRKCRDEIKKVVIEDGVTAIGGWAFENFKISEITIPDSVVTIGTGAFQGTDLSSVQIPDSVTEIGATAFRGCKNLTSAVLPSGLTQISEGLLSGCSKLASVQIPDHVTSIGDSAFFECGLTEIKIPDGVTYIGASPFENCPLKQITIPASVTEWGYAPWYCGMFGEGIFPDEVTLLCEATMDNVESLIAYLIDIPVTVHAPAGSVIEGYINRQIQNGAPCTFVPIG